MKTLNKRTRSIRDWATLVLTPDTRMRVYLQVADKKDRAEPTIPGENLIYKSYAEQLQCERAGDFRSISVPILRTTAEQLGLAFD